MASESPATLETPSQDEGTRETTVSTTTAVTVTMDTLRTVVQDVVGGLVGTSSTPALPMASGSAHPPSTVPLSTGAGPSRPSGKLYDAGN